MLLTWIVLPMVIAMTAAASSIDDIELQPLSKWVHCIDDGRLDIKWEVHGEEKLQSGLALPDYAERCKPSKASSCKWLSSCDAQDCSKCFPGELSGRRKCLVVINSSNASRRGTIRLDLQSAGNWPAIIFGVTITTLGLIAVVSAGCYSDLKKLAAGDHRRRKAPQVHQKPAAVAGNAALLSEPHIHRH